MDAVILNEEPAIESAESISQFREALRLKSKGRKLEAARCYARALQLQPAFIEAAFNLGMLFQEMGQFEQAVGCYRRALQLQPGFFPAWANLGVALRNAGRNHEAIASLRKALSIKPAASGVLNNLGNALRAELEHEPAIRCFRQALRQDPANPGIHENLGNALREMGRVDEAVESLQTALSLRPEFAEAHWDLAFALLLQGDLARGLEEYEWRWRMPDFPRRQFSGRLWQGQEVADSSILVHCEQGAGDAIQFVRFIGAVASQGAAVFLECPRSLAPLFESVAGVSQVIPKGETLPETDWHVPLLSLPHRLGVTLDTIPADVPYLQLPDEGPELLSSPRGPKGTPLKVGVCWRGNPRHANDRQRSLSVTHLKSLLDLKGVTFYSLQVTPSPTRSASSSGEYRGSCEEGLVHDFADTAALVKQMDLVISVDTSVAHLAGAFACPAWVLLPFAPDWRWLLGRNDSPWYPTLRLFRQTTPGDWGDVVERVRSALVERAQARHRGEAACNTERARIDGNLIAKVPPGPTDKTS